jgi:hypothetical protein
MKIATLIPTEREANWLRSRLWFPMKRIFAPIALLFIAYIVWLARFEIVALWAAADRGALVIACLFLVAANFWSPLASQSIFHSLCAEVNYRMLLRTHLYRLPARYLPGGVWHTVGRAADLHTHGVSGRLIACLVALENILAISMAFLLGGVLLLIPFASKMEFGWVIVLGVASSFLLLAAIPTIARHLWPNETQEMRFGNWTRCCANFSVIWALHAAAFVAYSIALVGSSGAVAGLHLAGTYLFSWAIGLIAFFAPQGIGVFEISAVAFSGQALSPANIALVAGFRLCMLVVDLCLGLIARFVK